MAAKELALHALAYALRLLPSECLPLSVSIAIAKNTPKPTPNMKAAPINNFCSALGT